MMTRYLSGLCVAGLGLCGGGWLVVAALAFGGESVGRAGRVNLLTGAALIAVCCLTLACWSVAWRQRLRADGVLADRFPLVSRRDARRNRRALSRDVRRAAKLAERSARGARRAARRSARLTGGALSEGGGVMGDGVALGIASVGDESYAAAAYTANVNGAAPSGAAPNGAVASGNGLHGSGLNGNGLNANGVNSKGLNGAGAGVSGVKEANGTAGHEDDPAGSAVNGTGATATGANAGERAAELISELRSMLEPLLAATGAQLAAAGRQPGLADQPAVGGQPATERTAGAAPPLPQRTRFASAARPRAMTPAEMAAPRVRSAPMSIPRLTVPDDYSQGPASDGEDSWW
jgi:hypothetical protein